MKLKSLLIASVSFLCCLSNAEAKSPKRGVSENNFQYKAQMEALAPGVSWCYNWGNQLGRYIADQTYMHYAPMCWSGSYNAANIRNWVAEHPETKYLLGFNEPNFKSQANMTPQQAAEAWPAVKALADELGLELVAPALNYSPDAPYQNPTAWMDQFVSLVGPDAFDHVAIHFYGGFEGMKNLATLFHDRYNKPVMVTEFCYWPGEMGDVAVAAQISSMVECVEWLEKTEWIEGYAWFKALEQSRANFRLINSGSGEDPRELTELGKIYVYMSEFDSSVYHPVGEIIPATEYISRAYAGIGASNDSENPLPIEISTFNSGATLDYQFDVPAADDYNLVLTVTGVGEPLRFDPKISVVSVKADGTDGQTLSDPIQFGLPGNETDYRQVIFPMTLEGGKQTIRIKDNNPYAPSGIRISTVRLVSAASVGSVAVDSAETNVDVVSLQGVVIRRNVEPASATTGLPAGIYIVGGRKTVVK